MTLQWFIENFLTFLIAAMNLKNILCQINANGCNLHIGRSYLLVGIRIRHFGTMMPFKVGATIPLAWVVKCLLQVHG